MQAVEEETDVRQKMTRNIINSETGKFEVSNSNQKLIGAFHGRGIMPK